MRGFSYIRLYHLSYMPLPNQHKQWSINIHYKRLADKIQKSKEKAKKEYDETQRKNKEWQKDPHYKLDGVQAREDGPPWKNLLYG